MIKYGAGNRYGIVYWIPDNTIKTQLRQRGVSNDMVQYFGAKPIKSLDSLFVLLSDVHHRCRHYKNHAGDCLEGLNKSIDSLLTWYAEFCLKHIVPKEQHQPAELAEGVIENKVLTYINDLATESRVVQRSEIASMLDAVQRLGIAVLGRNAYTNWVIQGFVGKFKRDIIVEANYLYEEYEQLRRR
jgi:hypothetical protein